MDFASMLIMLNEHVAENGCKYLAWSTMCHLIQLRLQVRLCLSGMLVIIIACLAASVCSPAGLSI